MVAGRAQEAHREHERGREELRAARQRRGAVPVEPVSEKLTRNQKDARASTPASFCFFEVVLRFGGEIEEVIPASERGRLPGPALSRIFNAAMSLSRPAALPAGALM